MEIGIMKARPPHVRFTRIAVEDRNKSIESGHPAFNDIDHVIITAIGSKDSVTKPVADWLENCSQQVREERLPAEWENQFRNAYEHWKRGEELPVEGTPLKVWPAISPAELESCKSLHILTVEDLAMANDEARRRLGMGGMALSQRAKKYLDASAGPGKLVAELNAVNEKFQSSEVRRLELEQRIAELEAKFGAATKVKVEAVVNDSVERKL